MRTVFSWPAPRGVPRLREGVVHVYRIQLDQPDSVVQSSERWLSAEEGERAERLHAETDRNRFIVGRGSLRAILGRYAGVGPEKVEFCYGANGKPELASAKDEGRIGDPSYTVRPRVQFNLSHSGGTAVLAIAVGRRVGIDIEQIRVIPGMDSLVAYFFSIGERVEFGRISPPDRLYAFLQAWTRKEAYLKATGEGLFTPPEQIEVFLEAGRSEAKPVLDNWFLQDFAPCPGFVGAIMVEGSGWRLRYFDLVPVKSNQGRNLETSPRLIHQQRSWN